MNVASVFISALGTGVVYQVLPDVEQTATFFYFVGLTLANLLFHVVNFGTKSAWVRTRRFTVYLPVIILLLVQVAAMFIFFGRLDTLNAVTNNAYPVNPADLAATTKYMWQTLFLYIFPPLLMGVTFCGYVSELGMYLDEKKA